MVITKRRNDCVDEAIKQKNEALSEIVERELSREEKDPNYEVTYTLKDLNRVKDHLDLIKHHVWIRDNILVDNGRTVFNIPTRRTVRQLTPEEREQRRQLYQQRRLERQVQRENQNPVTVRLPASNSATTSPSATVGTFGTTSRRRRRSNETPQSFSQAVSPRRSPKQVTPRVVTPPNNWDQLQNIRTFYQPLDFNLLNRQLAEVNLDIASDSSASSDTDYTFNTLESTPRNSTRRTVRQLTPEEREQRRQLYQQRRLERQVQRENQNPVTVRLPASNSATTSPSATVGTFGTTSRRRRRSNETPQSFSQAVSPRRSPKQVTPRVVTPPNNWDQLQNIRTFYQPLDFNLLNRQLAEVNLDIASDSSASSDTDYTCCPNSK
ncbi:hypothetical protein Glove_87g212 [Diversispora epigaea]|uniref:Uncharacterized protein n=1 Tax=Diversispora epigaea TaxID=1348612 RepID=A0A397JGU1_9GLOM|nr:hypothetical protein Glove_87g212 [Diversispora epigaea]